MSSSIFSFYILPLKPILKCHQDFFTFSIDQRKPKMPFIDISTIRPMRMLHVRVIRSWIPYGKRRALLSFLDNNGDAIEAMADLNHQSHFESCITLQCCYNVTKGGQGTLGKGCSVRVGGGCVNLLDVNLEPPKLA